MCLYNVYTLYRYNVSTLPSNMQLVELFTVFLVGGFVDWCLLLAPYWKEKSFLLNPFCWKLKSYFLTLDLPHGEEKENIQVLF